MKTYKRHTQVLSAACGGERGIEHGGYPHTPTKGLAAPWILASKQTYKIGREQGGHLHTPARGKGVQS
jgi:hypothetical protein